jgi:hypothetical protein
MQLGPRPIYPICRPRLGDEPKGAARVAVVALGVVSSAEPHTQPDI